MYAMSYCCKLVTLIITQSCGASYGTEQLNYAIPIYLHRIKSQLYFS